MTISARTASLAGSRARPRQRTRDRAPNTPRPGRGDGRSASGFLALSIAGFLIFTLLPTIGSLVMSLFNWPLFGSRTFVGLGNFVQIFQTDPVFRRVLLNTLIFVVTYLPLNILISLGLAAWISPRIRFRGLYRLLFFLPAVTPMVANSVVWQLIFTPRGVADWLWTSVTGGQPPNFLGSTNWAMAAVVILSVWQGFGYNMLVFSAGIDAVPSSLLEAATVDGAGQIRRFTRIVLPLLTPYIFFAVVLTTITSLQVFVQPYILTGGGPGVSTETAVLYLFRTAFQFYQLGVAAAVAWILFLIIMVFTAVQFSAQRRWVHYGT
jgi:multiple sugar transport system permease protein